MPISSQKTIGALGVGLADLGLTWADAKYSQLTFGSGKTTVNAQDITRVGLTARAE